MYGLLFFHLKLAQGVDAQTQLTYINTLCHRFPPNLREYIFLNMLFLYLALEKMWLI